MKHQDTLDAERLRKIFSRNLNRLLKISGHNKTELADHIGVSTSTASDWCNGNKYPRMDKIEKMATWFGVLKSDLMEEKSNRNIVPTTGVIPILGVIPAGIPIFAEENIEGYMPTMVKNPDEYFYLRVKGTSMINAGIPDGSLVLIHQQPIAENGEIVACRVNGDEATLKRFKRVKGSILLMPENPNFQPILVDPKDFDSGYAEIIGVAKQVIIDI